MKKWIVILILSLYISLQATAQFSIRLIVTDIATKKNEDVYVAGNFNNWNPREEVYKLKPFWGSRKSVVIKDLPAGTYAFKFTRGTQQSWETTADGRAISDRILEVTEDLSLEFTIAGWKDDYPEVPKKYTASPQVKIIDTAFIIPQLERSRRIWIYLPKGYVSAGKRYPVLYMQDGQNLFNEQSAAFGEWGVDECLDTLQKKINKECIIVGIDHGGNYRMAEYNPYDNIQFGKGEGKAFVAFIVNTLKPFIDQRFRTKKGPESTFIAGSSMGGLISLYAMLQYPTVFGRAGIFSPSLFLAPFVYSDAELFVSPIQPRFYLYAGGKESTSMVPDMQRLAGILQKKERYIIRTVVNPLGRHNEKDWRQEFANFYSWLMAD